MITSRTHQLGVKAKRYVTDRRGDATGRARLPGVHFPRHAHDGRLHPGSLGRLCARSAAVPKSCQPGELNIRTCRSPSPGWVVLAYNRTGSGEAEAGQLISMQSSATSQCAAIARGALRLIACASCQPPVRPRVSRGSRGQRRRDRRDGPAAPDQQPHISSDRPGECGSGTPRPTQPRTAGRAGRNPTR